MRGASAAWPFYSTGMIIAAGPTLVGMPCPCLAGTCSGVCLYRLTSIYIFVHALHAWYAA